MNQKIAKESALGSFHTIYAYLCFFAAVVCGIAATNGAEALGVPWYWIVTLILGLVFSGLYSLGIAAAIDQVYETSARVKEMHEQQLAQMAESLNVVRSRVTTIAMTDIAKKPTRPLMPRKSQREPIGPAIECPRCSEPIAQAVLVEGKNVCPNCSYDFEVELAR